MSVSKPRQIFVLREERSSWPGGRPVMLYGWHRCGLRTEMEFQEAGSLLGFATGSLWGFAHGT